MIFFLFKFVWIKILLVRFWIENLLLKLLLVMVKYVWRFCLEIFFGVNVYIVLLIEIFLGMEMLMLLWLNCGGNRIEILIVRLVDNEGIFELEILIESCMKFLFRLSNDELRKIILFFLLIVKILKEFWKR